MVICALIMAGGKGERFWPVSTEKKPKQFLNLIGEESMLQHTVRRLKGIIPMENIFIVTAKEYKTLINEHIPELADRNIIVEPEGRNTAACIALSAFYIKQIYENANLVVLPSDHLIVNEKKFRKILSYGNDFIDKNPEAIATIGINPTRPDTGYGYIYTGEEDIDLSEIKPIEVNGFKEKPVLSLAEKYLKDGGYLWNSGMFIWKIDNVIKLLQRYMPKTYESIKAIDFNDEYSIVENYKNTEAISIDYGIMEKADNIYVIPGDFGWDDLGSWNSLARYKDTDVNNNVIDGSIVVIDSSENIIQTKKKTYIMGVENMMVIETENEILVVNREHISRIKELKNYEK